MKRNRAALAIAAVAFLGWMIFLGTKARQYRHPPVIVSRAQLLAAEFDVVAQVDADPANAGKPLSVVTVHQVLSAADEKEAPKLAEKITVQNLSGAIGYSGPDQYVLPLVKRNGLYYLAVPPLDPGVPPLKSFDPRLYRLTDDVRQQFADIRAGKG